jgi:hypothetical protein
MKEGLKKIYTNRLELAHNCAMKAKTVEEFNFFVARIKEVKTKLEEV